MIRAKAAPGTGRFEESEAETQERLVRRGFWPKLARLAGRLPFAHDLLAAYYCAFDRQTPVQVRLILVGALAYFVLPFDGIPDVLPLMGFADDAAMLAAAMKAVVGAIRPEHHEAARRRLAE
jgi:uncharacterized membrane protein YkvA (DUF1232 family)